MGCGAAKILLGTFILNKIFVYRLHLYQRNSNLSRFRYLDPDPLLLATRQGQEANPSNPRFHALNQAIVQLVCFSLTTTPVRPCPYSELIFYLD